MQPETLDLLRDFGPTLRQHGASVDRLAVAIEKAPANVAYETRAVRNSFDAGLLLGLIAGAVLGVMLRRGS